MKWTIAGIFCAWGVAIWAQNSPIELDVQTSTRHYTDGTSRSSSRMLWSTEGVQPQTIGFLGKRIRPYLNEAPEVQQRFSTFRTFSVLQIAAGAGTLATLPGALNRQDEFPDDHWLSHWRGPIACGLASYATAIVAGIAFNKAVSVHNALVGGGSGEGYGWCPEVRQATDVAGVALVWAW